MAWYPKEQQTSFETQPLEGLYFLHGDRVAHEVGLDWTEGQKFPLLVFPSTLNFPLWEGKDTPILHLFGEMDLPLYGTRDEAFEQALLRENNSY